MVFHHFTQLIDNYIKDINMSIGEDGSLPKIILSTVHHFNAKQNHHKTDRTKSKI